MNSYNLGSYLRHLPTISPWLGHFSEATVFLYKMGIIVTPPHKVYTKNQ